MIPIRDLNPTRTTPWVTWTFLVVCGLVYLWQAVLPDGAARDFLFTWALIPRRLTVLQDQQAWLTVLTSMFMHGGFWHVLGNLWFLHIFGDNVEDNMGSGRFAAFYLLCGVAASFTQLLTNPTSPVPMVGASGAIAGVLAAYLVLFPRAQVVTLIPILIFFHWMELPAFVFIALWFVYQFFAGLSALGHTGGGVAYWAHIGGFVAGLALVFVFRQRRPPPVRVAFIPPHLGRSPWHDDRRW